MEGRRPTHVTWGAQTLGGAAAKSNIDRPHEDEAPRPTVLLLRTSLSLTL